MVAIVSLVFALFSDLCSGVGWLWGVGGVGGCGGGGGGGKCLVS